MDNQIFLMLKNMLDESSASGAGVETQRNALKEGLQYYVLNFVYHHTDYSKWIMYGGSALRMCHGLDRMSVDLDFEVAYPVSAEYLGTLKKELEAYFKDSFDIGSDMLTAKVTASRGLLLRFNLGDSLGIGHPSKQVHVKIDLNHFAVGTSETERWPINRNQLSFVITTYAMSTLMASKIAAIFLRGERGVGKAAYAEKGRDIYDLLWYMNKKVIPDLDYLVAKGVKVGDFPSLFAKLSLRMDKVSDTNLKQDLSPLFLNQTFIGNWLKNWRENYGRLLGGYEIHTVTNLESVTVEHELLADVFSFVYAYGTKEEARVLITYKLSDYWIKFADKGLPMTIDAEIDRLCAFSGNGWSSRPASWELLKRYATVFSNKTDMYLKKSNRTVFGTVFTTKLIRMTADKLNQKEQILLDMPMLLRAELDDLL